MKYLYNKIVSFTFVTVKCSLNALIYINYSLHYSGMEVNTDEKLNTLTTV